jgi:hypothetical protein
VSPERSQVTVKRFVSGQGGPASVPEAPVSAVTVIVYLPRGSWSRMSNVHQP